MASVRFLTNGKSELAEYRKVSIKAAKELYYGAEVIAKLKAAKSNEEITRIMKMARVGGIERDLRKRREGSKV